MANGVLTIILYGFMLYYSINSMMKSVNYKNQFNLSKVPDSLKILKPFRLYFFTIWNYALQIIFLILAVLDEGSKLAKLTKIQRRFETYRHYLFSTLVLPSSLLVMTIFWVIWHIDRELIFPKAVDDFYPPWLNHTLHTFIAIPLIVEVAIQLKNKNNYRISRTYAAVVITVYCIVYQTLYLSVYLQHGVWLYPIYTVLTWAQRAAFVLMQFSLILIYQQIGISLLKSSEPRKIKGT